MITLKSAMTTPKSANDFVHNCGQQRARLPQLHDDVCEVRLAASSSSSSSSSSSHLGCKRSTCVLCCTSRKKRQRAHPLMRAMARVQHGRCHVLRQTQAVACTQSVPRTPSASQAQGCGQGGLARSARRVM
eukprot:10801701-Alexandrium_andersonii.AAC.1